MSRWGIVPFKICFVCEFGFGFSAWGLGMEQGGSYYDMQDRTGNANFIFQMKVKNGY